MIKDMVARLTLDQRKKFYSDGCYYYESREGPYDYLLEQAMDPVRSVIVWNYETHRYELGRLGHLYGRTIYHRRQAGNPA